jgi:hypothetical protein
MVAQSEDGDQLIRDPLGECSSRRWLRSMARSSQVVRAVLLVVGVVLALLLRVPTIDRSALTTQLETPAAPRYEKAILGWLSEDAPAILGDDATAQVRTTGQSRRLGRPPPP